MAIITYIVTMFSDPGNVPLFYKPDLKHPMSSIKEAKKNIKIEHPYISLNLVEW